MRMPNQKRFLQHLKYPNVVAVYEQLSFKQKLLEFEENWIGDRKFWFEFSLCDEKATRE